MGFKDFIGNERVAAALRRMLSADRVPHALLFSGPRGVGKFTLARMFAQAANCERLKDDFCGACGSCRRTALLADPRRLIEEGLAERGESPDAATVERVPLILQPHPDVWAIVPDPVRLRNPVARPMIRMGQLRAIQRAAHFRPGGRRRIFILDGAETMRWDLAGVFLKILEEPPESATLVLIAPNPYELLDTIRSRCLQFSFAPVAEEQVAGFLQARTGMKAAERRLAAQLSGGCPGAALVLDVQESARLRREVVRWVELAAADRPATGSRNWPEILKLTAILAKDEKETLENILGMFYSVFNDLLELTYSPEKCVLRNPDLPRELEALSKKTDLEWVAQAVYRTDELRGRLRRNVNRQLGLEAVAVSLSQKGPAEGKSGRPV